MSSSEMETPPEGFIQHTQLEKLFFKLTLPYLNMKKHVFIHSYLFKSNVLLHLFNNIYLVPNYILLLYQKL